VDEEPQPEQNRSFASSAAQNLHRGPPSSRPINKLHLRHLCSARNTSHRHHHRRLLFTRPLHRVRPDCSCATSSCERQTDTLKFSPVWRTTSYVLNSTCFRPSNLSHRRLFSSPAFSELLPTIREDLNLGRKHCVDPRHTYREASVIRPTTSSQWRACTTHTGEYLALPMPTTVVSMSSSRVSAPNLRTRLAQVRASIIPVRPPPEQASSKTPA
jgi:hypothetical protein